ncbi:TPA: hypothetical protein DCX66_03670 [Candidatus Nomurabacteria bacterium]|uniref:Uncharacterized protein n=1 Tax=Candidatus Nomurabacteria bacterium GW2011_GWE1_35_16 TaxID=1618761 RepID=A0A0G0DV82_9BACT|nr:MAG: hypothetical protein UR55_C0001G0014 [Candidatus Nomurabacteria bacterium GW2011_GWF1_34_20]KKP63723.1 MAG: hypothetical protein UR57_C0001G0014 [Candidatus Nomurabacteria bacterium GW2011_GWE2_34_25]KKP66935.1 MAG: hypothetical protein UR64_C0001G0014 [Candidatus Nomurabacteria bacterium GW2011_GWE1_35_16]OGJ06558.1 MAG: hypothetical protein A2387_03400 [Candidatus Nomurabacteria bacterium RIFOXYB1_FULL_36_10]HAE36760.1 hypothetical protein [Candidatus Nomurabacteria bacterium]
MEENINFTREFLQIARIMAQKSGGKLKIKSYHLNEKLRHFVELNGEKIREDIEYYGEGSVKNKTSYFLPEFLFFINEMRNDSPNSYKEGMALLYKIGNKVFEEKILQNWNRIFQFYLGP